MSRFKNDPQTRNEKLAMIKGLLNGSKRLSDLPGREIVFFRRDESPDHFIDGNKERPWSQDEIKDMQQRRPQDKVTVVHFRHVATELPV